MPSQAFGEFSSPTDTIAAILGTYPFSVGLFRELLQNSDDAKASKQVFVLDTRSYPTRTLFDTKLSRTQGPALLSFNDALFTEDDWSALQSIHRSSKKTDTSKIGKYGIGFRSCYHVTDNPQILSGSSLAILDPHHDFSDSGGTKFDFCDPETSQKYADQLTSFEFFLPTTNTSKPFDGAIIRLPLRTKDAAAHSSLSSKVVDTKEIRTLFDDFITKELDITLLFLKNVKTIELWEVTTTGKRCLATASVTKSTAHSWTSAPSSSIGADSDSSGGDHSTFTASITVCVPHVSAEPVTNSWRVLQSEYTAKHSASLISYHLGRDARPVLAKHKLLPRLGIAVPLSLLSSSSTAAGQVPPGRLFTFLPLPIQTGFPFHIHGLFALTQSRQNLSNKKEIGIVRGSDDSVLIEWNQTLFDHYLPKTWVALFQTLLERDGLQDVFRLWPPAQAVVHTGDSTYWQDMPSRVFNAVIASNAKVWPVNEGGKAEVSFWQLKDVIVARQGSPQGTIQALQKVGMKITQPPEYVWDLLQTTEGVECTFLTPEVAYAKLIEPTSVKALVVLGAKHPEDCSVLLHFLLSTDNPLNISGLPIVQQLNGRFAALTPAHLTYETFTFLTREEFELFGQFDGQAIPLHKFTPSVADLLRTRGPETLNIVPLKPSKIASYLRLSPNPVGWSFATGTQDNGVQTTKTIGLSEVIEWLSRFWIWFGNAAETKDELFPLIASLHLLPSRRGVLESVDEGVFEAHGIDHIVLERFEAYSVSFVHPRFAALASNTLKNYAPAEGAIKSPVHVHHILDQLNREEGEEAEVLEPSHAQALLSYFSRYLPESCRARPLDEGQRTKLRALPIFPVLVPSTSAPKPQDRTTRFLSSLNLRAQKRNVVKITSFIPVDARVYCISGQAAVPLPSIDDVVFLDGADLDIALLAHLSISDDDTSDTGTSMLTDIDVLALGLETFSKQSRFLQNTFLEYMVHVKDNLPPRILSILSKANFIATLDGSLRCADHVVDPLSPLFSLFADTSDRIPKSKEETTAGFLKQLRALGLLRDKLTVEIVTERIQYISSLASRPDVQNVKAAEALSFKLLDIIHTTALDCTILEIPAESTWLPTNKGMMGHEGCLDRAFHRPELFDEVLPTLKEGIPVSPSLRTALGWDKPLPLSMLSLQLRLVLDGDRTPYTSKKLRALIKELAQRDLPEDDITSLKEVVGDEAWIPVSSSRLARTHFAVFILPTQLHGFYEIPLTYTERPEIKRFLERMGCTERPAFTILIGELLRLAAIVPATSSVIQQAMLLLRAFPNELSDEQRDQILVPDFEAKFRPIAEVHFNDLGDRAYFEAEGVCLAHPWTEDHVARKLRMKRLGLQALQPNNPGLDMGQKLASTIRNVLKQYTEQQTLTEFLANASDAGAEEFKIMIDEKHSPTAKLLTPQMACFQECASLIVYNNGTFSKKDFEGICQTGVGGKEGKTDTIGQFGLGALSMFHFTELAMILSGDKVMFLDPSKTYLPFENWASLLVPLSQMQRLYPDHLACLDGLFNYQLSHTTFYTGTLFRLPLRNKGHIHAGSLLQQTRSVEDVRDTIVRPYWKLASQSLLFTNIKSISTYYRDSSGNQYQGWSLFANRVRSKGEFDSQVVEISGKVASDSGLIKNEWLVVTTSKALQDLPKELRPLIEPHRLRSPITVGLAARIGVKNAYGTYNLFSTMPLPMTTTLPVHISGSFILTPDRRHIRFDDYENLETRYNRWLLADLAPPPYLYLLENMLLRNGQNNDWWPGNIHQQDNVSRILVDSFYANHLGPSPRLVCAAMFQADRRLTPAEAVMIGAEPLGVTQILALLPNSRFINLPSLVAERALVSMKHVDHPFLCGELRTHAETVIKLFAKGIIGCEEIQALVSYLHEERNKVHMPGLPVVPLANGTLQTYIGNTERNTSTVYVWKPHDPFNVLFQKHRLVHPDFNAAELVNGLDVAELSSAEAIDALVREHITPSECVQGVGQEKAEWIETFWKEFPHFRVAPSLQHLPIIPTTNPGTYVSLDALNTDKSAAAVTTTEPSPYIVACLQRLGMKIVRRNDPTFPPALRNTLQSIPSFTFTQFLSHVSTITHKLTLSFLELEKREHIEFAVWARTKIMTVLSGQFEEAKMLPIWPELRGDDTVVLRRATELKMLPYNVAREAALRFIKTPVIEFNTALAHIGVQPMDFEAYWTLLRLPPTISPSDHSGYRQILTGVIANSATNPAIANKFLVPNGAGKLVPPSTLYARTPLFTASFGSSPTNFILEEFRDLEPQLASVGLKGHGNLDLPTFIICATALNDDTSAGDRVARAHTVYQAYSDDLPLHISMQIDSDDWASLDNLHFIPRLALRQRSMRIRETSLYVKPLPEVITPKQALRQEWEAIGWTQRALLATEPSSRLLLSNPRFGVPDASEVVDHLLILATQVAVENPNNVYLLHDLQATYIWLDEHQDEAEDYIIRHHDQKIFLNVDDPRTETWIWHSADEMFFNIEDEGLKPVKGFLSPFKDLLTVAGVEEFVNPTVDDAAVTSAQAKLSSLLEGFNKMRKEGQLTDVVFITEDQEHFPAHRAILAPMSEYLGDLFLGAFTEAGPASADAPIEVEVDDVSSKSLGVLLDYMYTGDPPEPETLDLSDSLDALDLTSYWGLTEVNDWLQVNIIRRKLVGPTTFQEINTRANSIQATKLLEACQFYERENKDAIMRIQGDFTGPRNPKRLPKKNIASVPLKKWETPNSPAATNATLKRRRFLSMPKMPSWRRLSSRSRLRLSES